MSSTTQTTQFNVWALPNRRPSRRKTPPAPKPRNGLKHGIPTQPVATAHSPRRPRPSAHTARSPPRSRAVSSRVLPLKPGTCASPTSPVPSQSPSQWKCRARRRGFTVPWPPIGGARPRLPQRRSFRQFSGRQADKTKHYTTPQRPSLRLSRAFAEPCSKPRQSNCKAASAHLNVCQKQVKVAWRPRMPGRQLCARGNACRGPSAHQRWSFSKLCIQGCRRRAGCMRAGFRA